MKLNAIISGLALACMVAVWSAPVAGPAAAEATGGSDSHVGKATGKKVTKTSHAHKGGKSHAHKGGKAKWEAK